MKLWKLSICGLILFVQAGCSDSTDKQINNKQKADHIWKSQTKAIDKAREMESVINESAKKRLEQVDQLSK